MANPMAMMTAMTAAGGTKGAPTTTGQPAKGDGHDRHGPGAYRIPLARSICQKQWHDGGKNQEPTQTVSSNGTGGKVDETVQCQRSKAGLVPSNQSLWVLEYNAHEPWEKQHHSSDDGKPDVAQQNQRLNSALIGLLGGYLFEIR
jgi:hypothetical protein